MLVTVPFFFFIFWWNLFQSVGQNIADAICESWLVDAIKLPLIFVLTPSFDSDTFVCVRFIQLKSISEVYHVFIYVWERDGESIIRSL